MREMYDWEKLVEKDGIIYNNAPFDQTCKHCGFTIESKYVHQKVDRTCVPVKIHVHKYYKNTGDCYFPCCRDKITLEHIEQLDFLGRQMLLVTPEDVERLKEIATD